MIVVKFETPLAWTWYVFVGTVITFVVGSLASFLRETRRRRHRLALARIRSSSSQSIRRGAFHLKQR